MAAGSAIYEVEEPGGGLGLGSKWSSVVDILRWKCLLDVNGWMDEYAPKDRLLVSLQDYEPE